MLFPPSKDFVVRGLVSASVEAVLFLPPTDGLGDCSDAREEGTDGFADAVWRTALSVGLGDDRVDGLNGLGDPAIDGDFKEEDEENFEADGTEDFFCSAELELATGLVDTLEREARRVSVTEGLGFAGVDGVDESRCRGVAGELVLTRRSAIPKGVPMLFRLL